MPFPNTLAGWRSTAPPPQASRVFYAYSIWVSGAGFGPGEGTYQQVGTFQNFNPTSTRQVVRVRGIANNGGYPFELVPGPADTSINVTYLALYLVPLNTALGYPIGSVIDLNRQRVPFDIQEVCFFPIAAETNSGASQYYSPGGSATGALPEAQRSQREINHYYECYLSNVGRTITQGTVTIAETATIQVTGVAPNTSSLINSRAIQTPNYASLGATPGGSLQ